MSLNMKVEHMMKFHTFEVPTAIKHGIGSIKHVGDEVKNLGVSKALLVTDPGIYNAGVANPVVESLQAAGIEVVLFDKVVPNPPVRLVN
ncbi:iron-containing alcohol dehydrogenase, partial [Desertibacillus haloalkaliphilus]